MGYSGKSEREGSGGGRTSGQATGTSDPAESRKRERGESDGGRTSNPVERKKRKREREGSDGSRTSGQSMETFYSVESRKREREGSDGSRSSGTFYSADSRNRENEEEDKEPSLKRSRKRSNEHQKSLKQGQQEQDLERPERIGQKRKIEEEVEKEDTKRSKCDETEASTSSTDITPLDLSQFQIHQGLGQGAFGTVLLASLKRQNKMVALKAIPKRKKASLLREKTALLQTSGNPYICQAFACFQNDTHGFIVMEHLPGGDLEEMLYVKGPMDVQTTALCTAEIICGIQHLHQLGVIHRDLKTENILIDHQGHIRICDFGLAVHNVFGAETIFGFCGTQDYMAPEILQKDPYGSAADWWALGVIIFRLMTHEFPFYGAETLEEHTELVSTGEPTYPEEFTPEAADIIQKLLVKDWHRRLGWRGDVRQHPFYRKIDWQKIENKSNKPPFLPELEEVTSDISSYTGPALSFLHPSEGPTRSSMNEHIPGFSFIHPDWAPNVGV